MNDTSIRLKQITKDRLRAAGKGSFDKVINEMLDYFEHHCERAPEIIPYDANNYCNIKSDIDVPNVTIVKPAEIQDTIKTIDDITLPKEIIDSITEYYNSFLTPPDSDIMILKAIRAAKEKKLKHE